MCKLATIKHAKTNMCQTKTHTHFQKPVRKFNTVHNFIVIINASKAL